METNDILEIRLGMKCLPLSPGVFRKVVFYETRGGAVFEKSNGEILVVNLTPTDPASERERILEFLATP